MKILKNRNFVNAKRVTISQQVLAVTCLIILSWGMAEFITLMKVNPTTIMGLAIGIALGIVAEISFDLETLFVGGGIVLMFFSFLLMLLVLFLPIYWIKLIFIFLSVAFVALSYTVVMQWLIKNRICKSFGKVYGVLIAAIAIGVGIILI
jgi:hypothetical protein